MEVRWWKEWNWRINITSVRESPSYAGSANGTNNIVQEINYSKIDEVFARANDYIEISPVRATSVDKRCTTMYVVGIAEIFGVRILFMVTSEACLGSADS